MAADHALHQPVMRKMIEPAILAVALAGGIDQREVLRLALGIRRIFLVLEIKRFQGQRDFLGKADADESPVGLALLLALYFSQRFNSVARGRSARAPNSRNRAARSR